MRIQKKICLLLRILCTSLCSSIIFNAAPSIVLNLLLNLEQKKSSCSYKIVLVKKCGPTVIYLDHLIIIYDINEICLECKTFLMFHLQDSF